MLRRARMCRKPREIEVKPDEGSLHTSSLPSITTPTGMSTLQDFHEHWWGNDSSLSENTVIHLPAFSGLRIFAFSRSRLLESQDVIFHFVGRTLVFSKDGVKEIGLNFLYDSFSSPIWCLVDSYGGEPPPLELSDELSSSWAKSRYASQIILNPWSDEEISIGTYDFSLLYMEKYLHALLCGSNVSSFRRPSRSAAGSDTEYFDFRSPRLAQEVWDQLIHLGYEDALACFSHFRLGLGSTVAGRWLFQVVVRKLICQQTAQFVPLAPLQEMTLTEETTTFVDSGIRNHHCPPINSAERTPVFYSSTAEILCNTTSFYVPRKVSRDLLFDGLFFGHDPLPDYSGLTGDPTVLYILQTTTEIKNGASELGVDTICEVLHRYPGLMPIYLLVVPLPDPMTISMSSFPAADPTSSWTMPQSWFQKSPGRGRHLDQNQTSSLYTGGEALTYDSA
ncbi:hypothetical protein IW262DRAFT_1301209 [Armillaria fumosa]|nr:hypothetical protein IW262DRAFT_1301209 [Armillaria fumosa]